MFWETIFFASGSIFFLLSIIILLATAYYLLKIASTALSIEKEVKGLADDLKSKISAFSITFAGLITLLEKLIQYRHDSRADQKETDPAEPKKEKGPKKIKIASLDQE